MTGFTAINISEESPVTVGIMNTTASDSTASPAVSSGFNNTTSPEDDLMEIEDEINSAVALEESEIP